MTKFIFGKDDTIQFFLKNNTPLKTKLEFPKLGNATVEFYLAPRAEEVEYDDQEDDIDDDNDEEGEF